MQSVKVPDFLETGAMSCRSRSPSIVSTTDSHISRVNLMSPPTVRPSPAFISTSAASEIISADQEFNAADFVAEDEETGNGATAMVTPAALSLLNGFLDNLLFNILASSKSTQLASIRPAMANVLKPRLAKEVVAAAEEELSEYMGGEEDEQTEFRGGQEPGGDFDLVRSWKLTRLRCMVYTRLGDLEEEDEDEFIAQDGLRETDGAPRRFTSHVDNITPAASIFLTSIIEYIGERALVIAGETARSRLVAQLNDKSDGLIGPDDERKRITRLVVEDLDMEKLALNATLGRLWRTWRKRRRGATITRTLSRESFPRRVQSLANSRKSSVVTIDGPATPKEPLPLPIMDVPLPLDPATVPLPMSEYDVQEIEVPGYSGALEDEMQVQTMKAVVAHKMRPRSLMVYTSLPRNPNSSGPAMSAPAIENHPKSFRHSRSRSLPTGAPPAVEEEPVVRKIPSPTPSEKRKLETMYEDDESAEYVDAAESAVEDVEITGIAITTEPSISQSPEAAEKSSDTPRAPIAHEVEAPPAVNETIASLRAVATDDDEMTDQTNSARVSIASLGDRPNHHDPEIIEGTGTCEKPTLTATIQRPKRQPSREASPKPPRAISPPTSDPQMHAVAEDRLPTQGVETTPQSAAPIEAITSPDQDAIENQSKTKMISETPNTSPLTESRGDISNSPVSPISINSPRLPSTSPDSQRSKTRPRPAPLVVTGFNTSSSGGERASVQRMVNRPGKSASFSSGSSRENKRPVTSGSTTSQVSSKLKGLMGRPQLDGYSVPVRSSSESSRTSGTRDSADEVADLDKLINSDETIHYTLTPRSVREMTFPLHFPSPPGPILSRSFTGIDSSSELLKSASPLSEEKHRYHASVSSKATGTTAGTAGTVSSGGMTTASRTKSTESKHPSPITISRPNVLAQPRDARPPADSTRDLSEFMRLTGPPTPISAPRSASANAPVRTSPNPKGLIPTGRTTPVIRPPSNQSAASRGNRPKLQARPAETRGSSSDLIDFIREGPPMPQGSRRIPRTVAPFRNTIDSEDLQIDDTSEASSTVNGVTPAKSLSSFGSRTGLLTNSTVSRNDSEPIRKQRRVPDPYAIDDDEDDESLEELLKLGESPKLRREEESLMDFLRHAPAPPSEQSPQPFLFSDTASTGRTSSLGMKPRLLRTSQSSLSHRAPTAATNYSLKVQHERSSGSIPSASNRKTATSDLADFLRNSEPPLPAQSLSQSPSNQKGGFSRFFTRRKKVEV